MSQLNESQKQRIFNINIIENTVGTIGFIGGIIYANRTGGKFWRYVGYGILGGLVFRLPAYVISTPFKNKILKESESNKTESNPQVQSPKELLVLKYFKDLQGNPPKTKSEAYSRLSSYGLTKTDIDAYNTKYNNYKPI
jgi:hypothetical protein